MPDRYGRMDIREWDWRDRAERRAYRRDEPEDFGQADYSRDWGYDPDTRTGYRLDPAEQRLRDRRDRDEVDYDHYRDDLHARHRDDEELRRREEDDLRYRERESRSWRERGGLFGGRRQDRRSNDQVLWVVATEALRRGRGIDPSDIEVEVLDGVVTLNGTVRSREEKRRAEDLVDQRGVRDVQNNLRIRERRFF